jgi:hypothetical protein
MSYQNSRNLYKSFYRRRWDVWHLPTVHLPPIPVIFAHRLLDLKQWTRLNAGGRQCCSVFILAIRSGFNSKSQCSSTRSGIGVQVGLVTNGYDAESKSLPNKVAGQDSVSHPRTDTEGWSTNFVMLWNTERLAKKVSGHDHPERGRIPTCPKLQHHIVSIGVEFECRGCRQSGEGLLVNPKTRKKDQSNSQYACRIWFS